MVDRIQDIYEFNLEGNFERELDALNSGIQGARQGFADLAAEVKALGGSFRQSNADLKAAKQEVGGISEAARRLNNTLPAQQRVASTARVLANSYNQLVRETNSLNETVAREQRVLEQARRNTEPLIIQTRARARALVSLSKQLEASAAKEAFRNEAAKLGLRVSADGARLFNQEAVAAERAAKAIERVGLAEATKNILATQGRDETGKRLLVKDGKLTDAGRATAADRVAQKERAALLAAEEAALLKNNKAYIEATKAAKLAQKEINNLTGTGKQTESTFNRVTFTFRRLIGILAVFTVARRVVGGFNSMISSAIQFNAELETARVGIAGLIAAAGEVRDPLGNRLGLDAQVLESQRIAIDQMNKLRKDALTTAASYDELSRAFQSAVAPGIQSGLTLDQIREMTVVISQAATGLGLAQDQLAEEIRSLFQGTITPRNTRIATALGISNQDIARAKELGTLFEFLQGRFSAIARTGATLMNTFTGQLSNATDAFKQLLAQSSQPLFEQLKAGLKDVQKAIFAVTNDAVVFNPAILAAFKGLFQGLANGVQGIRSAFANIDIQGFAATLSTIGNLIGAVATALANTFATFFNVASPTLNVIGGIFTLFSKVVAAIQNGTGAFNKLFSTVTLTAAKGVLLVILFNKMAGFLRSAALAARVLLGYQVAVDVSTKAAVASAINLRKAFAGLLTLMGRFAVPLLIFVGIVAALDGILAFFGSDFRISTTLIGAFDSISSAITDSLSGVQGLKAELEEPVKNPLGGVENDFRVLKGELQDLTKQSIKSLDELQAKALASAETFKTSEPVSAIISTRIERTRELFRVDEVKKLRSEITRLQSDIENAQKQESANLLQTIERRKQGLEIERKAAEQVRQANKNLADNREARAASIRLGHAFEGSDFTNKLDQQAIALREKLKQAQQGYNDALDKSKALQMEDLQNAGKLLSLRERLSDLSKEESSLVKSRNDEIAVENTRLLNQIVLESSDRIKDLQVGLAESALSMGDFLGLSNLSEESIRKLAAAQRTVLENQRRQEILENDIFRIRNEILVAEAAGSDQSKLEASRGQVALAFREQELALLRASAKVLDERARIEAQIQVLRDTGNFQQGLTLGLEQFAKENDSLFNVGERFGQNLATGVADFGGQAIGEAITAAVDPNRNFDLREAAGNLFLSLGQGLITDLLKNQLSQLIQSLGINLTNSLTGISSAASSISGAAGTLAASGDSVAGAIGVAGTTLAAIVDAAVARMLAAAASIQGSETVGTAGRVIGAASGVAGALGGSVDRMKRVALRNIGQTHRGASGYAMGGRPFGVDSRDTIPAWLRPGEWVIRPEAVRLYGDRIFDLLNGRRLNPAVLRGISGSLNAPRSIPVAKSGFATGGRAIAATRRSSGSLTVQPLVFFDERLMDRALAAGDGALERYTRKRRGGMRAAVGLDE